MCGGEFLLFLTRPSIGIGQSSGGGYLVKRLWDGASEREPDVDVKTGDIVGRGSGGVAASISESVVSDVARPSNSRRAVGGVVDCLGGEVDRFFRPWTSATSDRVPGLVVMGGNGLASRSEESG